jgi:hypothetical protein
LEVRGTKTSKDVLTAVMTVAKKIRKTTVLSGGNFHWQPAVIEQYGHSGFLDEVTLGGQNG